MNHKRLFRLYREERLTVRRRGGRKRAMGTRAPMLVPQLPNERWSLDFVADQFNDGRRLRILVVVDDCSRECLALVPDTSISGMRVARELDRLLIDRGTPKMISPRNPYVWRIIQSSAPIPYGIVEDGMNVPDSRVHNYPAPLERRAHKTKNDCAVQRARARPRTSPA